MKRCFALLAAIALLTACGISAQAPAKPPAQPAAQSPAKSPAQPTTQTPAKPDLWAGLRFLLGSWEAKTTGGFAQAQASAGYAFRLELREHIMARHSRSGACTAPDDFNCQHSDLLYIYPSGNGPALEAIFFDNEGHVIHYNVTTPKPNAVVFLSDPAQPGPQYRLSYDLLEGVMSGKFELQMPGQTEFMTYLEWSGKRR
jgi:hypothetical protein